jgi:hypothetical protein
MKAPLCTKAPLRLPGAACPIPEEGPLIIILPIILL